MNIDIGTHLLEKETAGMNIRHSMRSPRGSFNYSSVHNMERNLFAAEENSKNKDHLNDQNSLHDSLVIEDEDGPSRYFHNPQSKFKNQTQPLIGAQLQLSLIRAIFKKDLAGMTSLLFDLEDSNDLDKQDLRGLTLLMLVTKLAYSDLELYYQMLLALLEAGADPRAKDSDGWSAFEEAVAQQNVKFCSILFDYLSAYKMRTLEQNQEQIVLALQKLPDYEVHLKWEFDSSVIPLVGHFAPSDTFKIWKLGSMIRLDSTIAGYKNLATKRRPMCVGIS